jgi:TRAP-type C4-dicarboxylate transport system permease large subunit
MVFSFAILSLTLPPNTPGSKKTRARGITEMKVGSARIRNILLISLLVPMIILVGIWGGWFGPLELATCTARGGQIIGDYGSGDV